MSILGHFLLSKSEFPFKNPNQAPASRMIQHNLKVGLQTLIYPNPKQPPPYAPKIVHSYTLSTATSLNPPPPQPPPRTPPPSWLFGSCVMGDMIGAESGDYMSSNVEDLHEPDDQKNRRRSRYRRGKKGDLPPPISLLSDSSGMPFVFKREATSDGSLIIRAERVTRHRYFEPHRHNGRLLLKFNPPPLPDDAVCCHDCGQPITAHGDSELERDLDFDQRQVTEEELESETDECEDIRNCVGLVRDSEAFWKGKCIDGPNSYLGRPGSASLLPVTTVI